MISGKRNYIDRADKDLSNVMSSFGGFYTGELGGKAVAPADYMNWLLAKAGITTDDWNEKQKRHDRYTKNGKGYSEYGSLNYPCMVSLAGDLDGWYDWLNRGWVKFKPEKCEG